MELDIDGVFVSSIDYPGTIGNIDSSLFTFYTIGGKDYESVKNTMK
jgi:hypothetical protein